MVNTKNFIEQHVEAKAREYAEGLVKKLITVNGMSSVLSGAMNDVGLVVNIKGSEKDDENFKRAFWGMNETIPRMIIEKIIENVKDDFGKDFIREFEDLMEASAEFRRSVQG